MSSWDAGYPALNLRVVRVARRLEKGRPTTKTLGIAIEFPPSKCVCYLRVLSPR